jgi:hypothetical protein
MGQATSQSETLFIKNKNIRRFTISGVRFLSKGCFEGCKKLTEIEIPEGITELPFNCFKNCHSLRKVTLPSSLRRIAQGGACDAEMSDWNGCFAYCKCLISINLPEGITEITSFCFYQCNSLKTLILPHSINKLNEYCIYYCSFLISINLLEGITEIPSFLFLSMQFT